MDGPLVYTPSFRDAEILQAIGTRVVPWAATQQEIRIWDASCATGAEALSLAMVFGERLEPDQIQNLSILATDREACHFLPPRRPMGQEPQEWFDPRAPRRVRVCTQESEAVDPLPSLAACIHYVQHDLLSLEPPEQGFTLIVCMHVLMHCSQNQQWKIVQMFHRALRPGGFLALDDTQPLPIPNCREFIRVDPNLQLFRKRPVTP